MAAAERMREAVMAVLLAAFHCCVGAVDRTAPVPEAVLTLAATLDAAECCLHGLG